jgi:transposase-like protein
MPRRIGIVYAKVPCPKCGSGEMKSCRRVGLEGVWPDVVLVRRYKCRRCGATFVTYEVADEVADEPGSAGPSPSTGR